MYESVKEGRERKNIEVKRKKDGGRILGEGRRERLKEEKEDMKRERKR